MKTVWKFEAPIEDTFALNMPAEASILSVQVQRGVPCVWALVDPSSKKELRTFAWVGTGHEHVNGFWQGANHRMVHRGSVQLDGGSLVFHLFENEDRSRPERL